MKKKVIILVIIAAGNIILVLGLNLISQSLRNTRYGFTRLFPPHLVNELETLELPADSYYIAGVNSGRAYLGTARNPLRLLIADTSGYFFIKKLSVDYPKPLNPVSIRMLVEDSTFYVRSGEMPVMLKGDLKSGHAKRYLYDSVYFSDFVTVGPGSAAIRMMSPHLSREVLAKVSTSSPNVKTSPDLLEKQVDGIFCTDGQLLSDRHGHLVYVYYYRNQFIYTDTSLNLLYRGKTIDTVSHVQIKVAKVEGSYKLAEPPLNVNQQSTIDDRWLYIHSSLLAQNEDQATFDQASVIDVYDLTQGDYKFSFYLFNKGDHRVLDFRVKGNLLFALFDNYLITYQLKANYFRK